jgi:hypothetical protein
VCRLTRRRWCGLVCVPVLHASALRWSGCGSNGVCVAPSRSARSAPPARALAPGSGSGRPLGGRSGGSGTRAMRLTRFLPRLASRGRELPSPLGLAFGLLHALASALELFFGNPQALLRDLRLQSCALERLSRLCCGRFGARARCCPIGAVTRAGQWCAGGSFFADRLPHTLASDERGVTSVTQ